MGFWDWLLGGPKTVEAADVIWLNREAKFRGIRQAVQARPEGSRVVLVVAHFPTTLAQVKEALGEQGLPFLGDQRRLSAADVLRHDNQGSGPRTLVALAEALLPEASPGPVDEGAGHVSILVAERHFLRTHDERIMAFAGELGKRCRVTFHLSLHDPLLRLFAGEWVEGVLGRLGAKEDEPIESVMVARRVKSAQGKFARQAAEERTAQSAEEWLELNAPGLKK